MRSTFFVAGTALPTRIINKNRGIGPYSKSLGFVPFELLWRARLGKSSAYLS
jgi:hypothetical protein